MASEGDRPSPGQQVARLYEEMESQAAQAGERFVGSGGFASMLGQLAENTAALTKLTADAMDLILRNLRMAGRRDVVRLGRQLARTEDKLERVLQELEELRDEVASAAANGQPARRSGRGNGTNRRANDTSRGAGTSSRRANGTTARRNRDS